jgi:hypothetical protein
MPLEILSSTTVFENEVVMESHWPKTIADPRFIPIVSPEIRPSFQLLPTDKIFCMGSCFARNVEIQLAKIGFDVVSLQVNNPYAPGAWGGNNFLIRYNPFSMMNELEWALDEKTIFPTEGILYVDDNLCQDPHSHAHYEPHTLSRLKELRELVTGVHRRAKECRVFVITLGLVEAWYDKKINKYMNLNPSNAASMLEPERFELHVLDYDDIKRCLVRIHELLTNFGHPEVKILITTSPVPLSSTGRGIDVITANTYSKSVLRSAAEWFRINYGNVDYFPSYESIMLSAREVVFEEDARHVKGGAVMHIMQKMTQNYVPHQYLKKS